MRIFHSAFKMCSHKPCNDTEATPYKLFINVISLHLFCEHTFEGD